MVSRRRRETYQLRALCGRIEVGERFPVGCFTVGLQKFACSGKKKFMGLKQSVSFPEGTSDILSEGKVQHALCCAQARQKERSCGL